MEYNWVSKLGATALLSCIIFSLFGYLVHAAVLLVFGIVFVKNATSSDFRNHSKEVNDISQFAHNLLLNYALGESTTALIKKSSSTRFWFHKELLGALQVGELLNVGNSKIHNFGRLGSTSLSELIAVLSSRSEGSAATRARLANLTMRIDSFREKEQKNAVTALHSASVMQMGTMIFFPLFAGVSISIMSSIGILSHLSLAAEMAIPQILVLYILRSNFFSDASSSRGNPRIHTFLLHSAIAMFIFRLSTALAINFI